MLKKVKLVFIISLVCMFVILPTTAYAETNSVTSETEAYVNAGVCELDKVLHMGPLENKEYRFSFTAPKTGLYSMNYKSEYRCGFFYPNYNTKILDRNGNPVEIQDYTKGFKLKRNRKYTICYVNNNPNTYAIDIAFQCVK